MLQVNRRFFSQASASIKKSPLNLIYTPGKVCEWTAKTNSDFLLPFTSSTDKTDTDSVSDETKHQFGAYTTMRTVGKTSVFSFDQHMSRLSQSSGVSESSIRRSVIDCLSQSLPEFYNQFDHNDETDHEIECKITVLVGSDEDEKNGISLHLSLLPSRPKAPVNAVIRFGKNRENAEKKKTDWVKKRRDFVRNDDANYNFNEIILCDPSTGCIAEGLSSNIAVMFNDCKHCHLFTPAQGVLNGTIRQTMLNADLLKEIQNISLDSCVYWRSFCVLSTSRLCLPINCLHFDLATDDDDGADAEALEIKERLRDDNVLRFLEENDCKIDFSKEYPNQFEQCTDISSKVTKLVTESAFKIL